MRTWQAWLAAAGEDQTEAYRAYLVALADEERAATAVQSASREVSAPACDATPGVPESPPR